jgi:hypothetical protein
MAMVAAAAFVIGGPAQAEDALAAFGLVGTWSNNCADQKGAMDKPIVRNVYTSPSSGPATIDNRVFMGPAFQSLTKVEIKSAALVTATMIKIVFSIVDVIQTRDGVEKAIPQPEKPPVFTNIVEKIGDKVRTIESTSEPPGPAEIRGGKLYTGTKATGAGQSAAFTYKDSGIAMPELERCPN